MAEVLGYQFDRAFGAPIEKYRQVSTISERDAIPTGKRWVGMLCYVTSEDTDFQLQGGKTNTNWEFVGSGDGFDTSEDTSDDITEGVVNLFMSPSQDETVNHITVTNDINLDALQTTVNALGSGLIFKGIWDASSGSFPSLADTGFLYIVDIAGVVDGVSFGVGDSIAAKVDSASTTTFVGDWVKFESVSDVTSVAGLSGVITKLSLLSALNVEDGATADQTGLEMVTLLNDYLSGSEWQSQLTANAVLDIVGSKLQSSNQSNISVSYNSTTKSFKFEVSPFIQVYADLPSIINDQRTLTGDQGSLNNYTLYEITDASDFSAVNSGRAWVRYKDTINRDETDFIIVSKEEGNSGSGSSVSTSTKEDFTYTNQGVFILSNLPSSVDVILNRTVLIENDDYTYSNGIITPLNTLYSGDTIIVRKYFNNSDKESFVSIESQTDFTLSTTPENVEVYVDRVYMIEGVDYTILNNIVTFTYNLNADSKIIIRKF